MPGKALVDQFRALWSPKSPLVTLLLSGGGDSCALFFLLREVGQPFVCLHFQHDSPGGFAASSVDFCQRLCQRHGVDLEVAVAQAQQGQRLGDLSWEAVASKLRYRALEGRPGLFLTAHTADDQAETVVMRLLDGSGLAGLAGIRPCRDHGRVQRPLLSFRRAQLRQYLSDLGEIWMDDPSNVDGNDRARLRHRLLPELERHHPALVPTLCRTAETLAADEEALTDMARDWLMANTREGDHWPLSGLRELSSAVRHRVLREIWRNASDGYHRPLGGIFRDCDRLVMTSGDDREVAFSGGGGKLRTIGAFLWLEPPCESVPWAVSVPPDLDQPLRGEAWALLGPGQQPDEFGQEWIRIPLPAGVFSDGKQYVLRTRHASDTYRQRSLKKLLASTGHPPWVRDRWPLLTCGPEVVAVPGLGKQETASGSGWLLFWPDRWRKMKL